MPTVRIPTPLRAVTKGKEAQENEYSFRLSTGIG